MNNNGRVYWPHLNQDRDDNPILTMGNGNQMWVQRVPVTDEIHVNSEDQIVSIYGQPDPQIPVFTWTEVYPKFRDTFHYLIHGYYAEAKPSGERWMEGFALRYYGYGSNKLWDHHEWLGDDTLHHTERLDVRERYKRGVVRVRIPARRYAGLHAYELQNLFYLTLPKAGDWAREIYRQEVDGWYTRSRDGRTIYMEDFPPGKMVTISYVVDGDFRLVNPYEERASERRARNSSTMDKNGKPRRR